MAGATDKGLVMSMGQKVVVSLMSAMLLSMCGLAMNNRSQLMDLRSDMRLLQMEIRHLRQSVELGMDDRYRASTASSDFKIRDERTSRLTERVCAIEKSIENHHSLSGHDGLVRRVDAIEKRLDKLEAR